MYSEKSEYEVGCLLDHREKLGLPIISYNVELVGDNPKVLKAVDRDLAEVACFSDTHSLRSECLH